jgi:hypothetical protein
VTPANRRVEASQPVSAIARPANVTKRVRKAAAGYFEELVATTALVPK